MKEKKHKNVLKQLSDFQLNPTYEPVKLYLKFKEYISTGDRIVVNIPFPEITEELKVC